MSDTPIKEYVTKDMIIGEIIAKYPPAAYALMACHWRLKRNCR